MPNIAVVLKDEIRRLAKREIKASTSSTKSAVAQSRRDIAALKRQVGAQQREIAFLKGQERKRLGKVSATEDDELEGVRHSARSVKAQRHRLKLSAADFGKLVGVSGLTVYNWENGKGRPKKQRLSALVAVRKMGRREAMAKLEVLQVKTLQKNKPR
jgi:DNA-binding transcriptional regulator YiaG